MNSTDLYIFIYNHSTSTDFWNVGITTTLDYSAELFPMRMHVCYWHSLCKYPQYFSSTLIPWVIIIFSLHISFLNPSVTGRRLAAGAKMRPNGTLAAYKSRTLHFCPFIAPHAFICSLTCSLTASFWLFLVSPLR